MQKSNFDSSPLLKTKTYICNWLTRIGLSKLPVNLRMTTRLKVRKTPNPIPFEQAVRDRLLVVLYSRLDNVPQT